MKNIKWPGLLILAAALVLTGCGTAQADYSSLNAEKTALETERNNLQSQISVLETENQDLQSDCDVLTDEQTALKAEKDRLESDLEDLQERFDSVNAELADIASIYPPRSFESASVLEIWLVENGVSALPAAITVEEWIGKSLRIQADAMADGYVINVDYDYDIDTGTYAVFCTTIIDGLVYFWDPETDDIKQDATLSVIGSNSVIYLQR